jgi:hypothetical protein
MQHPSGVPTKKVRELQHGDESIEYGPVVHREGRKVWFESRIVTFPSDDDDIPVSRLSEES